MKTALLEQLLREQRSEYYSNIVGRAQKHRTELVLEFGSPKKRPREAPKKVRRSPSTELSPVEHFRNKML